MINVTILYRLHEPIGFFTPDRPFGYLPCFLQSASITFSVLRQAMLVARATIVGIEINIETLTGKLKASQNQLDRNRAGVKAGIETREEEDNLTMVELIGAPKINLP